MIHENIRSDEGLTLEKSTFQSLYGGQFTLSTPLINQIFMQCFLTYESSSISAAWSGSDETVWKKKNDLGYTRTRSS